MCKETPYTLLYKSQFALVGKNATIIPHMKAVMTTKKISVSLTQELNDTIRTAVGTGAYKSSSEVIREALRQWKTSREREHLELKRLKAVVKQGLASGDSTTVTPEFFSQRRAMIRRIKTTQ